MICMCLGSNSSIKSNGHFSNASGMTVWLVYATVFFVISHDFSQVKPSSSINKRINSGAANVGCVSFICTHTFSGNFSQSVLPRSFHLAKMSCTDAEHNMYCCDKRKDLPSLVASPGYNTAIICCAKLVGPMAAL